MVYQLQEEMTLSITENGKSNLINVYSVCPNNSPVFGTSETSHN
jgi:hypothetical protein